MFTLFLTLICMCPSLSVSGFCCCSVPLQMVVYLCGI